jgi:hypothetical protein
VKITKKRKVVALLHGIACFLEQSTNEFLISHPLFFICGELPGHLKFKLKKLYFYSLEPKPGCCQKP